MAKLNRVEYSYRLRSEMNSGEKFFNGDLEERTVLLNQIAVQHGKLKERFTALPKEVQEKYREKFKGLGLADREKLLGLIASKKGEKSTEQKGGEKIESERLDNDFCAETKKNGCRQYSRAKKQSPT